MEPIPLLPAKCRYASWRLDVHVTFCQLNNIMAYVFVNPWDVFRHGGQGTWKHVHCHCGLHRTQELNVSRSIGRIEQFPSRRALLCTAHCSLIQRCGGLRERSKPFSERLQ